MTAPLETVIAVELTARLAALEALTSGSWPQDALVARMKRETAWRGLGRPDLEHVLHRLLRLKITARSTSKNRGAVWRLRSGCRVGHLCPLAPAWRYSRWETETTDHALASRP